MKQLIKGAATGGTAKRAPPPNARGAGEKGQRSLQQAFDERRQKLSDGRLQTNAVSATAAKKPVKKEGGEKKAR